MKRRETAAKPDRRPRKGASWERAWDHQAARRGVALLLAGLLLFSFGGEVRGAKREPAAGEPVLPKVEADAYILMSADTGEVFAGKDIPARLPMASTTKIMTGLLAAESGPLDQLYTVSAEDVDTEGSMLGLKAGDQLTLRDLMTGMLLKSGNDAAACVASVVAGDRFVERMNEKAAQLGMADTHFTNPSGLPDDEHYSSAYDMAVLARAALQNPDFAAICGSSEAAIAVSGTRWHLRNSNRLLREMEGAVGMKTGFTKKAGRCLVSAATRDGATLICVTLHCYDDWRVHKDLMDYGFGTGDRQSTDPTYVATLDVVGGTEETVTVRVESDLEELLLKDGSSLKKTVNLPPFLYAPVAEGQVVGEILYAAGEGDALRVEIVTSQGAAAKESSQKGFWQWLLGLFGKKAQ